MEKARDVAALQFVWQLLAFLIGVAAVAFVPVAGWVIGAILVLWALASNGRKVWRCVRCRSIVPRM